MGQTHLQFVERPFQTRDACESAANEVDLLVRSRGVTGSKVVYVCLDHATPFRRRRDAVLRSKPN